MLKRKTFICGLLLAGTIFMNPLDTFADAGMWLFNEPPKEKLKESYNLDLSQDWFDHARLSAVRFNSGGSGGFVSPDGLVVTNQHIAASTLQKLSTDGKNFFRDGFYAPTKDKELPAPGLELDVVVSIQDVTDQFEKATHGLSGSGAQNARKALINRLEKQANQGDLRGQVIELYQGGAYHLYRFQRYTDVRLVMAPEQQVAFYGGDNDNFEYPRYCLDVAFFRVYDKEGKPLKSDNYFRWNAQGPKPGEVVFVIGNPGRTNRLDTLYRLQILREYTLPFLLNYYRFRENHLFRYSQLGPKEALIANDSLFSSANGRKALTGQFNSLLDPDLINKKYALERELQAFYRQQNPDSTELTPWDKIQAAQNNLMKFEKHYYLFLRGLAFDSYLYDYAYDLVARAQELKKEDHQRQNRYSQAGEAKLKNFLTSSKPLDRRFETHKLAHSLSFMAEALGVYDPRVDQILDDSTPEERAYQLLAQTKLDDSKVRLELFENPEKALSSNDPLLKFALQAYQDDQSLRESYETQVEEPQTKNYALLAQNEHQFFKGAVPPDATFSLRLSYGTVKGYQEQGENIDYKTTLQEFYQRFDHLQGKTPYELPARWQKARPQLNMKTPVNFVSTADTIGGNSGSPVINAKGELVGINFDRNRHGLSRNFFYSDTQARHIAVHSAFVIESLDKVFGAKGLIQELLP